MDPKYNLQDVVRCRICETLVYSMYCVSCLLHLCQTCVNEHLSDQSKKHKVVPYKMRKFPPVCSKCPPHPKYQCKYYCRKCCTPVCYLCATVDVHKNHEIFDIDIIFENMKSVLKSDLKELNELFKTYRKMESNVSDLNVFHNRNFQAFNADLERLTEDKEYMEYLEYLEFDYKEQYSEFLDILRSKKNELQSTILEIEQCILNLEKFLNSNEVKFVLSYKTRNDEFRRLPQIPSVPMPRFPLRSSKFWIFANIICNKKRKHNCWVKNNLFYSDRSFIMNEPQIINFISAMYGIKVLSVSCLQNNNIWTSGRDNIMRQYNMQGKLVKSIKTRSGNIPRDITVTKFEELVYTDEESRTVNVVKDGKINVVIKLRGWRPLKVCCTSSNDLLVIMDSDHNHTKVVRYSGSDEKQIIQFNDNGEPFFVPGYYSKDICENKNLDICVADCVGKRVTVFTQFGKLLFIYIGRPSHTEEQFKPCGIVSDSQSRILVLDNNNNSIHILDKDGQLLSYIHNLDLQGPFALCIDSKDSLILAECGKGKLHKIQYCI